MSLDFLGADLIGLDAPSLSDVALGKAVLRRGMRGDAVVYVQENLGLSGSDADGDFGPKTEAVVRQFQKAKGLKKVDGEVGRDTKDAIDAMLMTGEKFRPTQEAASASISRPSASSNSMAPKELAANPTEEPSKTTTYAAYGLGAVAVGGLLYAWLGR